MSSRGSTSVQVSWQAVENADRFTVTLTKTNGTDQLGLCYFCSLIVSVNRTSCHNISVNTTSCHNVSVDTTSCHSVSVTTTSLRVVVGQTDDDMLRAYTTYSITVVAESDVWPSGSSNGSEPVMATTTQTGTCIKYALFFVIIVVFLLPTQPLQ